MIEGEKKDKATRHINTSKTKIRIRRVTSVMNLA